MKLIDLLVKELPKRGGWRVDAKVYAQDRNGYIYAYKYHDIHFEQGKWRHTSGSGICDVGDRSQTLSDDYDTSVVTREQYEAALKPEPGEKPMCRCTHIPIINYSAHSFLEKGVQHMKNRAAQRDSEDGERSMKACVDAFNAMFGHNLTETQGWQFMVLLKMARSRNKFNPDDYEDGAAYTGLAGEAHSHEQK